MKTAMEMRIFAERYKAGADTTPTVKLENCPFEMIEAALEPGEEVLFCFGALHEKAVALTERRLFHAETRNPAYDQAGGIRIIESRHINSVFSGNMRLQISLDGHEQLIYGNIAPDRIREAAEQIGDIVQNFKTRDPGDPV